VAVSLNTAEWTIPGFGIVSIVLDKAIETNSPLATNGEFEFLWAVASSQSGPLPRAEGHLRERE
jgi:hypothetical protein